MTDDRRPADDDVTDSAPDPAPGRAPAAVDAAESETARVAAAAPAAPRRGGRGLAFLALLVALAAAGGAGYLYYRLVVQAPLATLAEEFQSRAAEQQQALDAQRALLEAQAAALREELRRELTTELDRAQARLRAANADALAAAEAAMADARRFEARGRAPAERLWGLAEVDYLLRASAARRLLPQDVPVAAALLERADRALARLDDEAFDAVRQAVARELEVLEAYEPVDVSALYLNLDALQRRIAELPLAMPATGVSQLPPAVAPAGDGFWARLRAELEGLLRVRRVERRPPPLLPPQDVVYLGLNLRLQLERAKLALLRGEALLYRESLRSAREWLLDYALAAPEELSAIADDLARLAAEPLSQPPPPAADLLRAFREARADAP